MTVADVRNHILKLTQAFCASGGLRSVVVQSIAHPLSIEGGQPCISVEHDSRTVFPAASLAKLLIAERVVHSSLDMDEPVSIHELHDTRYPTVVSAFDSGRTLSISEILSLSLVSSDNACADYLLDRLGKQDVDHRARILGLAHTTILSGFRDVDFGQQATSLTSAADMATLLLHLYSRREFAGYDRIWRSLCNALYNTRIPALLPDEITVAHKTGSLNAPVVVHDAGIILIPEMPLLMVVLTQGANEQAMDTNREIAEYARAVYDGARE